jgi:hypothetical protein
MKPIQIWLPALRSSLSASTSRRDFERATSAWRGEQTVWLLPELTAPFRSGKDPYHALLAIPSEAVERIDVCHVGANGYIADCCALDRFPDGKVCGLLDSWLNNPGPVFVEAPTAATLLDAPRLEGNRVVYDRLVVELAPYGALPISSVQDSGEFTVSWPPEHVRFRTVSPDAESEELNGPFLPFRHEGVLLGKSQKTGRNSLWTTLEWPEPFQFLIPKGDGMDLLLALLRMRTIAKQSALDPVKARRDARQECGSYLLDGKTSRYWSEFAPLYAEGGEEAVLFRAEDHGIRAANFQELLGSAQFWHAMSEVIPIRRAWGPVGLFWALLLDRLEGGARFGACERCGRLIEGKKGKKFCGPKDNSECHAGRRAADQRKSRARRSSSGGNH